VQGRNEATDRGSGTRHPYQFEDRFEDRCAAARQGSVRAQGDILEACRQYLLLVANREIPAELVGKVGPSDLVQDTFVEAHEGFPRFQGNSELELLGWLRRILLNNLRDVSRRYQETSKRDLAREVPLEVERSAWTRQENPPSANMPSPSGLAIQKENQRLVEEAMKRLPPPYRRVIELRNFHLRPFQQIGQEMDRSPDAARKLWARAIHTLAAQLSPRSSDFME
jgi:RNA polymerase sigma-70 factor, ECF subfamily